MPRTPPPAILALHRTQEGVALRAQLVAAGMTRHQVTAQLDAKRWQPLNESVIVMHNGPLTERQTWWAAALGMGPLAGRTGLKSFGVAGWASPRVEVVVQRGERPEPLHGIDVKVHESRRFSPSHVHPLLGPPRLRLARCAVDAASWTDHPRAACGLLASVVQQRRATAVQLMGELRAAGRVRHVALLRTVLRDIHGGAQALSEVDLGRICLGAGLPAPERQLVRLDAGGRRRWVDARVTGPDGRSVLVEVDGALHLLASTYWHDMHRQNEIVIGGEAVLRFASIALLLEPEVVADQLRRAVGLPGRLLRSA